MASGHLRAPWQRPPLGRQRRGSDRWQAAGRDSRYTKRRARCKAHSKSAERTITRSDEPAYPELFQPITIGNCEIKNRIVMSPMNVLMSRGNTGYVTDQQLAYYAARAKGGTGLIMTECVMGTQAVLAVPVLEQPAPVQRDAYRGPGRAGGDRARASAPRSSSSSRSGSDGRATTRSTSRRRLRRRFPMRST